MELSTQTTKLEEQIKANINRNSLALVGAIFFLSISLALGLGYVLGKNNSPAPIIIQQAK